MFNTLRYTKKLEDLGYSREQAEAQMEIITDIIEGDLVTREEFHSFCKGDFQRHCSETREEFVKVRAEMAAMEQRILLNVGKMIAWSTALSITVTSVVFTVIANYLVRH